MSESTTEFPKETLSSALLEGAQALAESAKENIRFYAQGADPVHKLNSDIPIKKSGKLAEWRYYDSVQSLRDYEITDVKIHKILEARQSFLTQSIEESPLKSATDRDGNTLGNLLEINTTALKAMDGETKAPEVLKRNLEIIAREEESRLINETHVAGLPKFDEHFNMAIPERSLDGIILQRRKAEKNLNSFRDNKKRFEAYLETIK